MTALGRLIPIAVLLAQIARIPRLMETAASSSIQTTNKHGVKASAKNRGLTIHMITQYTYPSLGEAIKYFVSTMGILPRKNEVKEDTNTSEVEKKKIQKQIERLAREEGHLQAQFNALIPSINTYLTDSISCPIVAAQICSVANKLHESYKELLVGQGTFMSQRDTVLYFIKNFAIEACVTESSLAYLIYQDLRSDAVWPEEDFWYLPEERDGKIVWPIANAMKWAWVFSAVLYLLQ